MQLRSKTPSPMQETPPEEGHAVRMSLMQHLEELRNRLLWATLSVVIGTIIGFFVAEPVMVYLQAPYGEQFKALGPTDAVVEYFRVALLIGSIIAIPIITFQVLMFVLPGLTRRETLFLLASIPLVTVLFFVGVVFAWFVLIPPALGVLENFLPNLFDPEWTAELYLGFVTSLIFWMGVAFQTPLVFFVLSLLGFVSAGLLIRNWRIAIVGAAAAAALITPTVDPVNMFLVMGPLLTLYGLSILLVAIGRRFNRGGSATE